MITSTPSVREARALDVRVDAETLRVDLEDGRSIAVPLGWYPRLVHATEAERAAWRFIGGGSGISWTDLDEDVSVQALLAGHPSAERPESLRRWLARRGA